MAFADAEDAGAAFSQAHGVVATAEPERSAEKRPGRGVCEIDGMLTTAFQGYFATTDELVAALRARGVAKTDSDGRPRLVETPVVGGVPELTPVQPVAQPGVPPATPAADDDGWTD